MSHHLPSSRDQVRECPQASCLIRKSRITTHESRITNHESRITNHELRMLHRKMANSNRAQTSHESRVRDPRSTRSGYRKPKQCRCTEIVAWGNSDNRKFVIGLCAMFTIQPRLDSPFVIDRQSLGESKMVSTVRCCTGLGGRLDSHFKSQLNPASFCFLGTTKGAGAGSVCALKQISPYSSFSSVVPAAGC